MVFSESRLTESRPATDTTSLSSSSNCPILSAPAITHGHRGQFGFLQSFLVITSSVAAQISIGSIFILNFYISYLISYIRARGSNENITIFDGQLLMLLLATSYGMSGFPLGFFVSRCPLSVMLAFGSGLFAISYIAIYIGVNFRYGFLIGAMVGLGVSSMLINVTILLRCLRSYRDHWGVVSGTLLAVGFGATSIIHIWEGAMVNPLNINPVKLSAAGEAISDYWFYESKSVLDKCGEFYIYLGTILLLLLLYPVIVYRIYPDSGPSIDEHLALDTCFKTTRSITTDSRFLLAFTSFSFSGVSGMCARSSLKTFGESFINDERYLSSVGESGSFGAAVGALSMGLIMDMAIGSGGSISGNSPKLLLFNAFLCFTGTTMLMFADKMGKIWYLFSYDVTLLAFGGASSVLNMVLLEIFGISKFSIAFGITSLSTFFSGLWFTIASFSRLTWHDFWLAISLFSSLAVATAFGLFLEYRSRGGRVMREEEEESSDLEDKDDYIWHNGKKYVRQK